MKRIASNFTNRQKDILAQLGEHLKLARLRRKLSLRSLAERAGIAVSTLTSIEAGSPSVTLGNYLQVLSVLKLDEDILLVGGQDPLGRHIQDAGLMVKKRAPKKKDYPSVLDSVIDKGNLDEPDFE